MKPKVAIVILNFNGKGFLEQFLPGVKDTPYPNLEVVVADNGSTDDSITFLEAAHPDITLIKLAENYGFAGGYNKALDQVQADYFVLLNSDVEVSGDWVTPIIEEMENDPNVAAAQPTIKSYEQPKMFEHAGAAGGFMDKFGYPFCRGRIFFVLEKDDGQYRYPTPIFWATGAAFFIRAELYHRFEGLDADYFAHMEEIDLCWVLKRAGYKIMAYPFSEVLHVGGGTLPPSNPRKTYLNFRNGLITLIKNEPGSKLLWLIPLRLVLDGLAGFRFMTEGKFKDIFAVIKAHFYVYFHVFSILNKRRHVKQLVKTHSIGPADKMGVYHKSIVWQFFVRKKRFFKDL
ncbi:MAG: glycosyltransferase family 2 protein [Bacteroidota bacterium]